MILSFLRIVALTSLCLGLFLVGNRLDIKIPIDRYITPPEGNLFQKPAAPPVTFQYLSDTHTKVVFSSEIGDVEGYSELIDLLEFAAEGDHIELVLAGYGGQVHTGARIFNAAAKSKAKVTTTVTGPVYSMHAMLTCLGPMTMEPNSYLMFHDFSASMSGKGNESIKHLLAVQKLMLGMLQVCQKQGVLTEEQIEDILEGKDLYIHPK